MNRCFDHRRVVGFLNKVVFFMTYTKQATSRFLFCIGNTLARLTLASADSSWLCVLHSGHKICSVPTKPGLHGKVLLNLLSAPGSDSCDCLHLKNFSLWGTAQWSSTIKVTYLDLLGLKLPYIERSSKYFTKLSTSNLLAYSLNCIQDSSDFYYL